MQFRLRTLLIVLAVGPMLVGDCYFTTKWWLARQAKTQAALRGSFKRLESLRTSVPKHPSGMDSVAAQTVSPLP